jgi:hypothetical protein
MEESRRQGEDGLGLERLFIPSQCLSPLTFPSVSLTSFLLWKNDGKSETIRETSGKE